MTLREKIDCMEAFERGEEIEVKSTFGEWLTITDKSPCFRWEGDNYRIKHKQTVTIEKWLINYQALKMIVEVTDIERFLLEFGGEKVKLLDTYEVEI